MLTETVKKAIECSNLSTLTHNSDGTLKMSESLNKDKSTLDIKVPPLDDEEFMDVNSDSDNGFVEVNPVQMNDYKQNEQD